MQRTAGTRGRISFCRNFNWSERKHSHHQRAAKGLPGERRVVDQEWPHLQKSPPHDKGTSIQLRRETHTPMSPGPSTSFKHRGGSTPNTWRQTPQLTVHDGGSIRNRQDKCCTPGPLCNGPKHNKSKPRRNPRWRQWRHSPQKMVLTTECG